DLPEAEDQAESLEQDGGRLPLLAEDVGDEVGGEEEEPEAERHPEEDADPIRLDEGLEELGAPIANSADRRIERLPDDRVNTVGEQRDAPGQADDADPGETDAEVGDEHGALDDDEAREGVEHQ